MINPFARPLSSGQKRGRAIEARLKTEELRLYAGKPGRQVRWTDRTGVISSLGAVTDPHVSQAVLSWKPITPIWREVARIGRRKQEQTDKLKQKRASYTTTQQEFGGATEATNRRARDAHHITQSENLVISIWLHRFRPAGRGHRRGARVRGLVPSTGAQLHENSRRSR